MMGWISFWDRSEGCVGGAADEAVCFSAGAAEGFGYGVADVAVCAGDEDFWHDVSSGDV